MTDTPINDQPGFVAEEPEHCDGCYGLILPASLPRTGGLYPAYPSYTPRPCARRRGTT